MWLPQLASPKGTGGVRLIGLELGVRGGREQGVDHDRVGRARIVHREPDPISGGSRQPNGERGSGGTEGRQLPVDELASRGGGDPQGFAALGGAGALEREIEEQKPFTFRRLLQGEALLQPGGIIDVPLQQGIPLDLAPRSIVAHLTGADGPEGLRTSEAVESQGQQRRGAPRHAVDHADARRLEVGAERVAAIGRLKALIVLAGAVLARGDVLLSPGDPRPLGPGGPGGDRGALPRPPGANRRVGTVMPCRMFRAQLDNGSSPTL